MKKFNENSPIYQQLKEEIEAAIIAGNIREDEQLSSIRNLAQEYRINPQTVANAVGELLQEGYLYKKRGIGMFVKEGSREKLYHKRKKQFKKQEFKKILKTAKLLGFIQKEVMQMVADFYEEEE
ncbi:MAG: GntR family transcriptional regulator [Candidatus Cloacimonadota bacterium]|nr:GntR family transcriptional regulator [Candidatus Cloacimonadota bacterium]